MGVIAASLTMEVCCRIARIARIVRWFPFRFALGLEALHRRLGFDQGALQREVFVGQQPLVPGQLHHRIKESCETW